MIEKNCDLCGKVIKTDKYGNGKCKVCKWENSTDGTKHPSVANPPNFVSLNDAKKRYSEGTSLMPNYEELMVFMSRGLDISFKYRGKRYLLEMHEYFSFWEVDTKNFWKYETFEDLKNAVSIDGVLLRDIWDKVTSIRFEC
jgi:hypothetical protein